MRASTLAAGLVSVCILLVSFPGISALPNSDELSTEHDVSDENAVELPDYDLYGGPPANRGAYDYVITVTYGGYGPPPPPSSSSVVSSLLSSGFNQSFTATAASSVLGGSLSSGLTVSVPLGALYFSRRYRGPFNAYCYLGSSLSSLSGPATTSALVPTSATPPGPTLPQTSAMTGSNTPSLIGTPPTEGTGSSVVSVSSSTGVSLTNSLGASSSISTSTGTGLSSGGSLGESASSSVVTISGSSSVSYSSKYQMHATCYDRLPLISNFNGM
ncbi:hypothetical protein CHU98_g4350 [Xylaria longipes]|nr:hypothetical protein CHU98_g4350 [Xylaria longipes]